jgi:hypothetical protein
MPPEKLDARRSSHASQAIYRGSFAFYCSKVRVGERATPTHCCFAWKAGVVERYCVGDVGGERTSSRLVYAPGPAGRGVVLGRRCLDGESLGYRAGSTEER